MKGIGTDQLLAMKFERLALPEEWAATLGNLPIKFFVIIIYGESGEGKTEFSIQMLKVFSGFGRCEWLAYETGHDADIQDAVRRNDLMGAEITWIDPWERWEPGLSLFQMIEKRLKMSRAKFFFIDSYDATKLTEEETQILQRIAKQRNKCLIWIAHGKNKEPQTAIARKIEFYGHVGIWVKHYIAHPMKYRYGGTEPKVIYEKRARERNPNFFIERESKAEAPASKVEKKARKKKKEL